MSTQPPPEYDRQDLAGTLTALAENSTKQVVAFLRIQKLLLEGQPVSPERVASTFDISRDEARALVSRLGAEVDEAGNVVGLGLSVVPTPHSYRINGRQLYVWCAADAITFPIFHKASAVIESPDPISGETVRLIGTPEGAREVEPSTAVVTWVPVNASFENIRATFCAFTNFFTSVDTASEYVGRHPGLRIVPVDEVFRIGKLLWEKEPFKSMIAAL